jgi:ribosomal protein S19
LSLEFVAGLASHVGASNRARIASAATVQFHPAASFTRLRKGCSAQALNTARAEHRRCVMAPVPATHVFRVFHGKSWMTGPSPAMTGSELG